VPWDKLLLEFWKLSACFRTVVCTKIQQNYYKRININYCKSITFSAAETTVLDFGKIVGVFPLWKKWETASPASLKHYNFAPSQWSQYHWSSLFFTTTSSSPQPLVETSFSYHFCHRTETRNVHKFIPWVSFFCAAWDLDAGFVHDYAACSEATTLCSYFKTK